MTPEMLLAIAAFASGIAGIISAILLNRKTMALLEYRLGEVEKKLDSNDSDYDQMYDKWGARFEEIEKALVAIQKDVEFIKNK